MGDRGARDLPDQAAAAGVPPPDWISEVQRLLGEALTFLRDKPVVLSQLSAVIDTVMTEEDWQGLPALPLPAEVLALFKCESGRSWRRF